MGDDGSVCLASRLLLSHAHPRPARGRGQGPARSAATIASVTLAAERFRKVAPTEQAPAGESGHQRRRVVVELLVLIGIVLAGILLRGMATSDLWRDESLTVNIAKLSPHGILTALRHDGHPPLYYLLLHEWMALFGQGDVAVRALSASLSIATLPLIYRVGHNIGGRSCAIAALVLMATSPQAVRYATETRMYALVAFLATVGWLALRAAYRDPTLGRLAGVAVCTAALLLTHYWSMYLVAVVGGLLLVAMYRGEPERRRAARRVLGALVVGAVLFLPWLPAFLAQLTSTGAPWGAPARPALVLSSLLIGTDPAGEDLLMGMVLAVLIFLAVFGRAVDHRRIELDLRGQRDVRTEVIALLLVLGLAVSGGYVTAVTFAARYTAVVFSLMLVLAAVGVARLPSRDSRAVVLGCAALLGLVASLHATRVSRTQLGDVGRALGRDARRGDLVVYCPDQLAPTVLRYGPKGLGALTYPETSTPQRVDWVDYRSRVTRLSPERFARIASAKAGTHALWFVWSEGFALLDRRCEDIVSDLNDLRPHHKIIVTPPGTGEPDERGWLYRYDLR